MKIDKRLTLVVPIPRGEKELLYVHSTPVSVDVFRQYWEVVGQTMNALYSRGFGQFSPRFACEMLKKIAAENGGASAAGQAAELARVEKGFLAEIRRMTNVFALGDKGWAMVPLDDARKSGVIDEDEADEVDNAIVYFTCASRSHLKSQLEELRGALSLWSARIESLSCMEFKRSLQTSIEDVNTGVTAIAS
jgi:prophage DNA circulation protein